MAVIVCLKDGGKRDAVVRKLSNRGHKPVTVKFDDDHTILAVAYSRMRCVDSRGGTCSPGADAYRYLSSPRQFTKEGLLDIEAMERRGGLSIPERVSRALLIVMHSRHAALESA